MERKIKFTPKKIYELEQETGKPLTEILGDSSIKNIAMIIKYGIGETSTEKALAWIERWLEENKKDIYSLYVEILKVLQKTGFLPRSVDLTEVEKALQNPQKLEDLAKLVK